jgi:hypothetical protein
MPIPTSIGDLSTTASLNSPAGSDNLSTTDDYLRAIQGIVKTVYDAQGVINSAQTTTNTGKANLSGATFTGDISVPDEAYGVGWNGSLEVPTKNAVYDKIETLGAATDKIQPIAATVGSNALTVTLNPTILDFRSATLTSGTVNTRTIASAISCVVPSTATLGTVNAVQSRIAVLAIDNAGTVELAVVNMAGGNDLSETGVISTTALSATADSNNVIYSTTARTNVPYRVVGYVESTQATAGTWATAPSTIQGYGGQALAAMSSLGYGQTWQNVSGSRASGTTYYNTTGKPIAVYGVTGAVSAAQIVGVINGVTVATPASNAVSSNVSFSAIVPAGQSYSLTFTGGLGTWTELR